MTGQNNGGKNNFYKIPPEIKSIDDLIQYLEILDELDEFLYLWQFRPKKGIYTFTELPEWVEDLDTLNEWLGDSFYFGNCLKTFWVKKGLRHNGTSEERELNKRKHYLDRLKEKAAK